MSLLGVGSAPGSSTTTAKGVQNVQQEILGYALVACGVGFLLKAFLHPRPKPDLPFILQRATR